MSVLPVPHQAIFDNHLTSQEKHSRPALTAEELNNSFPLIPLRRFGTREAKAFVVQVVEAVRNGEVRKRARKAADESRYHDTVEALIANLAAAYLNVYDPERWIGVSFNNTTYAGTGMQVETMRDLRDYLDREGLVEVYGGYRRHEDERGDAYGRNTRIRSSGKLQLWFDQVGINSRSFALPDSAIIRMKAAPSDMSAVPDDVEVIVREEVFVEALDFNDTAGADANAELDHEVGQPRPVNQDHTLLKAFGIIKRLLTESGGGYEYALASAKTHKAADKPLHLWSAHHRASRITLGLHVDAIKPKAVFVDYAVDATITALTKLTGGILVRAAIAHGD